MSHAKAKINHEVAMRLFLVLTLSIIIPISQAYAAEFGTGVYVLGYQSSLSGYQPAPAFYLRNDFYVYQGNAKILPFSRRIEQDLRGRVITDLVTATYVTPLEILGAHYAVGVFWSAVANSFLKGGLQVDIRFPLLNRFLSRSSQGDYTGVGDLLVTPINLGWHLGQFHIMAFGNFYAPVGSYNPERRLNTGLNRWALEPNLAVTWLLPRPREGSQLAARAGGGQFQCDPAPVLAQEKRAGRRLDAAPH